MVKLTTLPGVYHGRGQKVYNTCSLPGRGQTVYNTWSLLGAWSNRLHYLEFIRGVAKQITLPGVYQGRGQTEYQRHLSHNAYLLQVMPTLPKISIEK